MRQYVGKMFGWYVPGTSMAIKVVDVPDPVKRSVTRYRAGVIFIDSGHAHTDGNMMMAGDISIDRLTAMECFMKTVEETIEFWSKMMDTLQSSPAECAPVRETMEWWNYRVDAASNSRMDAINLSRMSWFSYKCGNSHGEFDEPSLAFLKCVAADRPAGATWTALIQSDKCIETPSRYSYDHVQFNGVPSSTKEEAISSLEVNLGSVGGILSRLRQTAYDAYISIDQPECLIELGNVTKIQGDRNGQV